MMEFPSLNLTSHLWCFNQVKGVYMAIFTIFQPFPRVFSSKKPGINWKKQLLLADHAIRRLVTSDGVGEAGDGADEDENQRRSQPHASLCPTAGLEECARRGSIGHMA